MVVADIQTPPALARPQVLISAPTNAQGRTIKIVVVADVICPWCYITLRELRLALSSPALLNSGARFDVEWRPFFLLPRDLILENGEESRPSWAEYFEGRYGKEAVRGTMDAVRKRGKELGMEFDFKGKIHQTMLEHRLLYRAYHKSSPSPLKNNTPQFELLESLFSSFFSPSTSPRPTPTSTSLSSLPAITSLFPVPSSSNALTYLTSQQHTPEVNTLISISAGCGITGVPFTVVEGKWAVQGGGEYEDILTKVVGGVLVEPGCGES